MIAVVQLEATMAAWQWMAFSLATAGGITIDERSACSRFNCSMAANAINGLEFETMAAQSD